MLPQPLYLAPPSTPSIREQVAAGRLGAILNPASGNGLPEVGLFGVDNAVYGGKYPGNRKYLKYLERFVPYADRCLFVTAPDEVGDAFATVARSRCMLKEIRAMGFPAALVAQDFMEFCPLWDWDEFDCLFIGGSTAWKLSPAAENLGRIANSIGIWTHVGRVNSLLRYRIVRWALSVDGTYLQRAGPDRALPTVLGWVDALPKDDDQPPGLFDTPPPDDLDPWDGGYDLASWHKPPPLLQATRRPVHEQLALL
ncbi:hypothetical protein [Nonomuraea cavernae]|uniref:Uncharacterized protein n=1 Tax=Nonomuraea cavernae TaxID=2045107 RepID=A0A917YQZ1_9ACTN|nr:hypothetical protein [Nonomuraea cavernae]MCA2184715.1 hypothetical protein [Nonomuraea cavernae]GGO62976.1 hypothetical protein GCM10012289_08810 [Nonomuraea cavernae]